MRSHNSSPRPLLIGATVLALAVQPLLGQQTGQEPEPEGFRFRSGVELINVNASVTDPSGRFVGGLLKDDFRVLEDGRPQTVTHFNNERVPVSLGIVLDTSGSMAGEKIAAAKEALERFLGYLGPEDEVFLYRFDATPELVQEWTTDRRAVIRALGRVTPHGGTAMYDAVAEAVDLAQTGQHTKKALVVISDGNDTNSMSSVSEVKRLVRETEVLVYAVGIDGRTESTWARQPRMPIPLPIPGRRGPFSWPPRGGGSGGGSGYPGRAPSRGDERVNVSALQELTDDSGGRTEIVRSSVDLGPATRGIADELSRQYYLGYSADGKKDGRWHAIRVEVRNQNYVVRARRGYVGS